MVSTTDTDSPRKRGPEGTIPPLRSSTCCRRITTLAAGMFDPPHGEAHREGERLPPGSPRTRTFPLTAVGSGQRICPPGGLSA